MMEKFSYADIQKAELLGGTEIDLKKEYEISDDLTYYDCGGHKERSIANELSHLEHWKKVDNQNQKTY